MSVKSIAFGLGVFSLLGTGALGAYWMMPLTEIELKKVAPAVGEKWRTDEKIIQTTTRIGSTGKKEKAANSSSSSTIEVLALEEGKVNEMRVDIHARKSPSFINADKSLVGKSFMVAGKGPQSVKDSEGKVPGALARATIINEYSKACVGYFAGFDKCIFGRTVKLVEVIEAPMKELSPELKEFVATRKRTYTVESIKRVNGEVQVLLRFHLESNSPEMNGLKYQTKATGEFLINADTGRLMLIQTKQFVRDIKADGTVIRENKTLRTLRFEKL